MIDQLCALFELAAVQHGAFARWQTTEFGIGRDTLRRLVRAGRLRQPAHHVFVVVGTPPTWLQQLWCAHLEAGPDSAISHRAAARLLGLPGFNADAVEITKWENKTHRTRLGRLHVTSWLPATHVTVIEGLPVTRIARCVFDLAGDPRLPFSRNPEIRARQEENHAKWVRRVFNNSLLHCGNTVEQQIHVVATLARRGRPGTAVMRAITADLGPEYVPTESELEALFLDTCRAYGLTEPEPQVSLGIEQIAGRVDFYFREARIVVELDSAWHDTPDNAADDGWRNLRFAAMGILLIRIRWRNLVQDPERVMRDIEAALANRTP